MSDTCQAQIEGFYSGKSNFLELWMKLRLKKGQNPGSRLIKLRFKIVETQILYHLLRWGETKNRSKKSLDTQPFYLRTNVFLSFGGYGGYLTFFFARGGITKGKINIKVFEKVKSKKYI